MPNPWINNPYIIFHTNCIPHLHLMNTPHTWTHNQTTHPKRMSTTHYKKTSHDRYISCTYFHLSSKKTSHDLYISCTYFHISSKKTSHIALHFLYILSFKLQENISHCFTFSCTYFHLSSKKTSHIALHFLYILSFKLQENISCCFTFSCTYFHLSSKKTSHDLIYVVNALKNVLIDSNPEKNKNKTYAHKTLSIILYSTSPSSLNHNGSKFLPKSHLLPFSVSLMSSIFLGHHHQCLWRPSIHHCWMLNILLDVRPSNKTIIIDQKSNECVYQVLCWQVFFFFFFFFCFFFFFFFFFLDFFS